MFKKLFSISLLPIFDESFTFFIENALISPNQSGFKPGDSCINQHLAITHEMYKSFDDGFEIKGVFLDISKESDTFWHEGLIFKSKQNGISSPQCNVSPEISVSSIQCLFSYYWSNTRFIKGETIP